MGDAGIPTVITYRHALREANGHRSTGSEVAVAEAHLDVVWQNMGFTYSDALNLLGCRALLSIDATAPEARLNQICVLSGG